MNTSSKIAKGALGESLVILLVMFVLAIIFAVCLYVGDTMKPTMDEILTQPGANQTYQLMYSRTPFALDNIFIMSFVLLWVGSVILAYFVDTHPAWFALVFIALGVVIVIAGILSNTYTEFSTESSINTASSLPMTDYVMEHLVQFIIAIAASIMISLFAKNQT